MAYDENDASYWNDPYDSDDSKRDHLDLRDKNLFKELVKIIMDTNTKYDKYLILDKWEKLKINERSFIDKLGRENPDVEFSSLEEYLLAYILKTEIAELAKIERRHGYLSVEEFNRKEKLTRKLRDILVTLLTFIGVQEVKDITDLEKNPGFINKINAIPNDIRVDDVIRRIYDNTVLPNLEDAIKNTIKVVYMVIRKAKLPDPGRDVKREIAKYLGTFTFSRKSARKPRKSARKPRKSARKSARKPRKSARKPRKSARKSRKSARKPRKSAR